ASLGREELLGRQRAVGDRLNERNRRPLLGGGPGRLLKSVATHRQVESVDAYGRPTQVRFDVTVRRGPTRDVLLKRNLSSAGVLLRAIASIDIGDAVISEDDPVAGQADE